MTTSKDILSGRIAVVTGATSGVGRSIALALSRQGVQLCLVGRNPAMLEEAVSTAQQFSKATGFLIDLTAEEDIHPLLQYVRGEVGKLDILIHSAGAIYQSPLECARIGDLDLQYAINVRAPYLLTQSLLPLLASPGGQVVFINSSAGLTAKRAEIGQYAASKHALKAIADSLREEVNPKGIRVLSVYLGRTATPMQEALHRQEEKEYHPEALLQAEDIAGLVVEILMLPSTAEVTDVSIRPMTKS